MTAKISEYIRVTGIPAFAVGIVRGQDLVYARGFGRVRRHGSDDEVTPDTVFPSCSTAKPLAGSMIMKLVEGGLLELDRPVIEYLPRLQYPEGGDVSRVTLRHLLTHTSGLSSDPDFPGRFFRDGPESLGDHVRMDVPCYKVIGPPGQVFWYSNPGFNIAGYLAEYVTGTNFSKLVNDLILAPASMTATSFDPASRLTEAMVEVEDVAPPAHLPIPYPAGGAVTTIRDLSKFAISHMHGGVLPQGRLLEDATVSQMHTVQADSYSRAPRWYGLAFVIEFHNGRKLVSHGGGGFGCGSNFVMVPEEKTAVITLFNHPAGYDVRVGQILDEMLGPAERSAAKPKESDQDYRPLHAGTYSSVWPGDNYPTEIVVTCSKDSLQVAVDGEDHVLTKVDDAVYVTEDRRSSVGFVPGCRYLMYDSYGIGLVSAWPYRRMDSSSPTSR